MEAYRVPFGVDRSGAPRYRLVNRGPHPIRWVRVELDGPGVVSAPLTPRLGPGETLEIAVRGARLAESSRLLVRWLRDDGEEYLWAMAF